MDVRTHVAVITVAVAVVSYPLTFVVWPPEVPATAPIVAQALGYVLLAAECLAMGAGVAFLRYGYRAVKNLSLSRPLTVVTYLGISYCLLNWWTHDHLHALAFTLDFYGLLWMSIVIDYVFHIGMMLLAAVMALFFVKLLTANRPGVQREEATGQ